MSPLDRKLLRDLWRTKAQAVAIMAVIGVGVLLLVMMDGLVNSLDQTRQAYYDRYKLADVFAPVKRAPSFILDEIAELDEVRAVEGRINGAALIDINGMVTPVRAQAVSLPMFRAPRLNDYYLTEGRDLDTRKADEILLLKGFADAHGLHPGDSLTATMHGARRSFQIVGLAQAPEFLYTTAPGELAPDDRRFAVIWMNEDALAAVYDVEGAFNEALIAVESGADPRAVIAKVDRMLAAYGSTGAYALEDHFSNRFITEEISGLRISSRSVPPVFMAVAAFLLYIVTSRMIASERIQIGLLKAFGYTSFEIARHYFKLVLVISVGGALLGCALGVLSGQALAGVYQLYYKFPFLLFEVDPRAFIVATVVSIASAAAGGLFVLRHIFVLTPAVAMQPPAPEDYSRSARLMKSLRHLLDQPSRIIARRLMRRPLRALTAIIGIAAGMGISVAMLGVMAGFDLTIEQSFSVIDRSDSAVSFVEPMASRTRFELQQVDGVIEVEPFRAVPVVFRNGVRTYRGVLSGLIAEPRLTRPMKDETTPIFVRDDGVVLSVPLARILAIEPGDLLTVEVREGRHPVLELPVVGLSDSLLGAPAYFELSALNRALREPDRLSGAYLRVDASKRDDVYTHIKDMPAVAGLSDKQEARAAFQKILDEGAGATRFIMAAIAAVITFGIIFNSARIAYSEQAHELASLRVLGFTKGEVGYVLLGEFGLMILLALPIGILAGSGLADLIAHGFSTEIYTIPSTLHPGSIGLASLVVIVSATVSGWLVKRDVDRLDMVAALKSRE